MLSLFVKGGKEVDFLLCHLEDACMSPLDVDICVVLLCFKTHCLREIRVIKKFEPRIVIEFKRFFVLEETCFLNELEVDVKSERRRSIYFI